MSRGQWVVLAVFLALAAAFAAMLGPLLGGTPRPTATDPGVRDPRPAPVVGARPAGPPREAPSSGPGPGPAVPPAAATVEVRGADGAPVPPAAQRWVGATRVEGGDAAAVRVRRVGPEVSVGAPGHRYAAATDAVRAGTRPGARASVALVAAGPAVVVSVVEADGTPAADVPVRWPGPDGRPFPRRTDAAGRVVVDDQPPGLVVLDVGGSEREGPTVRVVVGRDPTARAVLAPPFVVVGRVLDAAGAPVADAAVRGETPDGPGGAPVRSGPDGRFVWRGRLADALTLRVGAGPRDVAVGVPPPDPLAPLRTEVEVRLPASAPALRCVVDRRDVGAEAWVRVTVEPAVLAWVRDAFGPAAVGRTPDVAADDGRMLTVHGAALAGHVRVSVDGDVTAEDHLVGAAAGGREVLRVVPGPPRAPSPVPAPDVPPEAPSARARPPATLTGRVVAVGGAPLPGVTVAVEGVRSPTDAAGRFRLEGLEPGARVELVLGYVDGADAGPADPRPFAPWARVAVRTGGDAGDVVLPRAAGARFRAVRGIDGRPLTWVRAVVLDGDGGVRFDGLVTLADGHGALAGLAPGSPGTLWLVAPGLRREVALSLRGGETVDVGEVSLVAGQRVEGTVRGPDGAPVAGAGVALLDDGREDVPGRRLARAREDRLRRTVTGPDGRFVLEGLDPSRPLGLGIVAPGFAPAVRRPLPDASGRATLAVALGRGAPLRLRVEDPKGRPVPGAAVELRDARTGVRWLELVARAGWGGVVGADDDVARAEAAVLTEDPAQPGAHRLGPVEPGPYDVLVGCPGHRPARARYAVPDPSPGSADNPLRLPLEAMEWTVVLEPDAPETPR